MGAFFQFDTSPFYCVLFPWAQLIVTATLGRPKAPEVTTGDRVRRMSARQRIAAPRGTNKKTGLALLAYQRPWRSIPKRES